MNIAALKEQARRHEQREEWQKALESYREAIRRHPEDLPTDITLFNRVGDLQTRLGQFDGAVEHYQKAIDLYVEAELPNNAIAICKKVLRNLPDRHAFFLVMGKIRAGQGFLTDARQNFLTYAERMTALGNTEGALDALVEFVDLAPEDVEIRLGLASQLESHGREAEALEQYSEAYRRLALQERDEEAAELANKLTEIAPELEMPTPEAVRDEGAVMETGGVGGFETTSLADIQLGVSTLEAVEGSEEEPLEEEAGKYEAAEVSADGEEDYEEAFETAVEEASVEAMEALPVEGAFDESMAYSEEPSEGMLEPLPLLGMDDESEDEEEEIREPLPAIGLDDDWADSDTLPRLEPTEEPSPAEEAVEEAFEEAVADVAVVDEMEEEPTEAALPVEDDTAVDLLAEPGEEAVPAEHLEAADRGDLDLAISLVQAVILSEPDQVEHRQRLVEYAFRKSDEPLLLSAYQGLAECLARIGQPGKAGAVFQQVLSLDPTSEAARAGLKELGQEVEAPPEEVASSEEYVDLGSLILGEEGEKTTRWTVTADAPTGDEEADFAKMLSQFKEKVSEHLAVDDVAAHYDLGTAYMEMGLLDEAIAEFQMALRASPGHLPTHEVMGRCWIQMEQPDMAVRALKRALDSDFGIEDELIGIYYLMGKAQETLGNTQEAVEFYEKVFSLDINFEDVTERLRALR